MATDAHATTETGPYQFRERYGIGGRRVDSPELSLAEMAERACHGQPNVLAFIARNWRPSASAITLYAEYLLCEEAPGEHRRLLELIHRKREPGVRSARGPSEQ